MIAPSDLASSITALLGPTNTGKTHRAIERMLEHESGIIGLPLRLLAREVYDKISTRVGEQAVSLLTGEERRIPKRPRYWVCTVEAMPSDLVADFLAVDEIQLMAHPERGHTFTDRLLHARGRRETWFMGSDTVRGLISQLLPTAKIQSHPRLSRLLARESEALQALPPRSAVVAFSTPQVYEIAERLRQRVGGAAVVLGALSPRTRNAQVALYQAGEVDYLVATDAIGMGLNMDIDHVAFAALRKFDGREGRELEVAELAQVAGRAGRHLNDGSFGTVAPLPNLPFVVARAIEEHRFASERKAVWRNSDLEYTSVAALIQALKLRPSAPAFRLIESADDTNALVRLAERPEVRRLAQGQDQVKLLWEICQIPDYRKLLADAHADLLGEIFVQVAERGVLDADWVEERIARIDVADGDLDAILSRIGFIRTWTYIANHGRWLRDAPAVQERTRAIEDRLSDAVHERLVSRFVERGRKKVRAQRRPQKPRERARVVEESVAPDSPFAKLQLLRDKLSRQAPLATHAETATDAWIATLIDASHEQLRLARDGRISFAERVVAKLQRGPQLLAPKLVLLLDPSVGAGQRRQLERRLSAFVRDATLAIADSLTHEGGLDGAARGLAYQLKQRLGTLRKSHASEQIAALGPTDVSKLRQLGVVIGERYVYLRTALRPALVSARVALLSTFFQESVMPKETALSATSFRPAPNSSAEALMMSGFPLLGERAVRVDIIERVIETLARGLPDSAEPEAQERELCQLLGCSKRELWSILQKLERLPDWLVARNAQPHGKRVHQPRRGP